MPRAKVNCPLPQGHAGRCRTPEGMRTNYDGNITRLRTTAEERYRWMDAYKVERGCTDCGYNADPRALDFDHVRGVKVDNISRLIRHAPMAKILAELEKCVLRCSNCHRTKTFERRRPVLDLPDEIEDGPCDEILDHLPVRGLTTVHSDHLPGRFRSYILDSARQPRSTWRQA